MQENGYTTCISLKKNIFMDLDFRCFLEVCVCVFHSDLKEINFLHLDCYI